MSNTYSVFRHIARLRVLRRHNATPRELWTIMIGYRKDAFLAGTCCNCAYCKVYGNG